MCTDSDGQSWDLGDLAGEHTVTGPPDCIFCPYDYDYHWNFCENVVPPPGACSNLPTTSAFRLEQFPTPTLAICDNMGHNADTGSLASVEKIDSDAGGLSIQFQSASSSSYSLTINLNCDEGAQGTTPTPPSNFASAMVIDWNTAAICPGGGGPGWAITLIILCGGLAYVLFGVVYGRSQNPPKSGDGTLADITHIQARPFICVHLAEWLAGRPCSAGAMAHPDGDGAIAW